MDVTSTLLSAVAANSLDVSRTSSILDCAGAEYFRAHIDGVTTGTPVGVWRCEGSDDPQVLLDVARGTTAAKWVTLEIPDGAVHGLTTGQAHASGDVSWDGTNALNVAILLKDPMRFMRVKWVRTSGGSSASLATVRGSKHGT
jgi:hypothetical protein